jgi:DNA-binding GntR family transcriptional regulator
MLEREIGRQATAEAGVRLGAARLDPLAPVNLAAQVADRIVDAIADGRLKSGQRLIESELAADLGISRIPVREALRELESQGLLVSRPHRGIRLIEFDAAWLQQLYEMRVALERVSWRHAAAAYRREPPRLARLDALIAQMRAAVEEGDRPAVNRIDISIHETLCAESGSPLMMTLWRAIRRHVLITFARETSLTTDLREVLEQHLRLRALLQAGDERALEHELQEHVLGYLSLQRRPNEPPTANRGISPDPSPYPSPPRGEGTL